MASIELLYPVCVRSTIIPTLFISLINDLPYKLKPALDGSKQPSAALDL